MTTSDPPSRIVVVDEDSRLLEAVGKTLGQAGYEVLSSACGAGMLELCRQQHPDLVLLGADMPNIDSLALCRKIKSDPDLKDVFVVLVLGGEKPDDDRAPYFDSPADDCIVRPTCEKELLTRIRTVLRLQKAQRRLRQSQERFHLLADNTLDPIWVTDMDQNPSPVLRVTADGDLLYANQASRELLEQWGREADGPVSPEWRDRARNALESGRSEQVEETCEDQTYLVTIAPNVEAGFVNLYAVDITDRKLAECQLACHRPRRNKEVCERAAEMAARIEEVEQLNSAMVNLMEDLQDANRNLEQTERELRAANRELEAFSYSVSHDLRAPLRGMDSFSLALMEDYSDQLDETGKNYIERIRAAAQRMGQLIDDLLLLSRASRTEMEWENVDLSALAREVLDELAESEPDRRVTVSIKPGLWANGDRRLLRQVFANLLGNAWKFTKGRKEARIEVSSISAKQAGRDATSKKAFIRIRDNGAGFDMAYSEKLFQPFQRLHGQEEFPGTGIGLATVQRIVRRHGGEVWAQGKANEGATFYVSLVPIKENL